ncbi:MAG TPA: RNA-binding protein [Saprospiraceae bacterium]|nr:RNA-binding protein [Saprospiraceae bacterium]MCB9271151.1 RNA-binding protein [Lewinellaceae bacterium]HPG09487.1 RNA-binding protein [Saprospiraceae bacterium]HPR01244.1 RNA-binding protein [Saprospiraceae bacterium]HQU51850.1 RNA-binding protein [Saprospiraceae bacterium]
MNIFVGKLNYATSEDDLRQAFEAYGAVSSCKIIMDRFTGRSKGFAFVEMDDNAEATAAIDALNNTLMDGRTIVVNKARPREDRF